MAATPQIRPKASFPLGFIRKGAHSVADGVCGIWERGGQVQASLLAGTLAYLLALFVSFPGTLLHRNFYHQRMHDTLKLTHDFFARDLAESITAYRLTVPVLSSLLHISNPAVITVIFQILPSVASLALIFFNTSRRLGPRHGWPITLALGLSFLLFWTFYYGGIFDPITHLSLLAVMTTANPVCGVIAAFAGVLNDERFVISAPFALMWHFSGGGLKDVFRETWKPAIGVGLGIGAAFLIRHALTAGWWGPAIATPEVYKQIWSDSIAKLRPYSTKSFSVGWAVFALNTFMAFRWIWIYVVVFMRSPLVNVTVPVRSLLALGMFLATLSTAIVMDVSKSIGFLFPAVLFCIAACIKAYPDKSVERLWWVVGALVITPVFCINGIFPAFWLPFPIEGVRYVLEAVWGYDVIRELVIPLVHSDAILVPVESWKK